MSPRKLRLRAFVSAFFIAVGAALVTVPDASAQPPVPTEIKPPAPPTPNKPDEPPLLMNYITMILIIAAVVGANLIPSKRGHQD